MESTSVPHYIILGAGISGLALAWFLQEKYQGRIKITVIEKEKRVGGYIQTAKQGDFLFEQGPHGCRTSGSGHTTLQLIEALGLQHQVIVANPAAKKKYRWIDQSLQSLPTGIVSLLFSPFLRQMIAAWICDWRASRRLHSDDETIDQFITRRCGKKIAETIFDPLVTGIYAGDIRRLSIKSCFPQLYQWEKEHGSLFKGMLAARATPKERKTFSSTFMQQTASAGFFSLHQGMEQLPQALAKKFRGNLLLDTTVEGIMIPPTSKERITVHIKGSSPFVADYLFCTLSAQALHSLIGEQDPVLTHQLMHMRRTSIAVVNVGYHSQVHSWKGFGYLIPSQECEKNLGVVWDSTVFPQQNLHPKQTRLTVMLGGEHMSSFHDYCEEDFLYMACKALAKQMKILKKPDTALIRLWKNGIPQYEVGHSDRLKVIQERIKGLSSRFLVAGNWLHGVSVNDCIAIAKQMVGNLPENPN